MNRRNFGSALIAGAAGLLGWSRLKAADRSDLLSKIKYVVESPSGTNTSGLTLAGFTLKETIIQVRIKETGDDVSVARIPVYSRPEKQHLSPGLAREQPPERWSICISCKQQLNRHQKATLCRQILRTLGTLQLFPPSTATVEFHAPKQ